MATKQKKYDLIIIGAGPAGLTAAIYASRRKLKTLVLSKTVGGQMGLTDQVENYPGFDFTSGFELADKMRKQAVKWGAEVVSAEVKSIKNNKSDFIINVSQEKEYSASAVILAFGLTPRSLGVPGEEELIGKGVTYCATCDGPLFKNKTVGVVGGGNSALESVEYLSKLAKKVYLIHFRDNFTAVPALVERVKKIKNVEFLCCSRVKKINGANRIESIDLLEVDDTPEKFNVKLDGLFIEIGYQAKTDWLKGLVKLNKNGEIVSGRDNSTSVPGIFVAGDCSDTYYKQIVIAAGEGAKSALQAYNYISEKVGRPVVPDWGRSEKK